MNTKGLRQKILDIAIHGKLVPQNPNDESAEKLLERIRAEKAEKIKNGEMKADKKDSFIFVASDKRHYEQFTDGSTKDIEDNLPFELPAGWAWCRLGELCELKSGNTLDKSEELLSGDYLYIKVSDMNLPENSIEILTSKTFASGNYNNSLVKINSIIFPKRGGALLTNKKRLVLKSPILMDLNLMAITPYDSSLLPWIQHWFNNIDLGTINNGSNIPQINNKDIAPLFIPLPPLKEQTRIVGKIEEIFAQIDALEQNKGELQCAIKKAKAKILDLAIHGQLVPQEPSDESAEELLKKIVADEGRSYEKVEDEPFALPASWCWVKLNDLAEIARGGSPRPIQDYITEDENGINWIKIGDTSEESKYITSAKEKIKPEGMKHSRFVHAGDFLLTNSMSFGRPYILKIDGCIHDGWLVFANIKECLLQDYLYYALSSAYIYETFSNVAAGSTVKNLKSDTVKQVAFPLPPLAEQKRIVGKIEQLFAQLDSIAMNLG